MFDHFGDDSKLTGELMRGQTVRQPFIAEGSVLQYILIAFATYQRRNLSKLTIDVCKDNITLRTETISASTIEDNGYHKFNTNLSVEEGNEYEVRVYSENGTYGNSVTAKYGDPKHEGGERWIRIGSKRKRGELCFTLAYSEEGGAPGDVEEISTAISDRGTDKIDNETLRGNPVLSIIIPTAKRLDHLKVCLDSLRAHTSVEYEVIVISNTPDKEFPIQVQKLLLNQPNYIFVSFPKYAGYVATCNAGAAISKGEYICILNDDTIAGKKWVDQMIRILDTNKDVAQVGPCLTFFDKTFTHSCKETNNSYIEGWCFVVPRWVYEKHGLFDPCIDFAYCEDSDFSTMLQHNGYKIRRVNSSIRHLGTQTSKSGKMKGVTDGCEVTNKNYLREKWKGKI